VANSQTTSTVTIYWHESSLAHGRAVRKAETSTVQGLYLTLNAEEPLVAAIRMLAGLCLEIQQGGRQCEERFRGFANEPMGEAAPADYPTTFEAGRFVVRKLARSAQLRWKARGKEPKWFVAMRRNSGGSITDPDRMDLTGFGEVPLPRGSDQMAGPFLWEAEGRSYVLFEEVAAGSSRGRLGCVEVFENGSCSEMKIILQRDCHLSYPCVVPANGELFLLPEAAEAISTASLASRGKSSWSRRWSRGWRWLTRRPFFLTAAGTSSRLRWNPSWRLFFSGQTAWTALGICILAALFPVR
jgi:hypothetical protein